MVLITASWCPLGAGSFFTRTHVYDMRWESLKLAQLTVACAPYAGPIALANNIDEEGASTKANFAILLYTACGQAITTKIAWKSGEVKLIAWSLGEELICVRDDGRVLIYNLFGQLLDSRIFTMGNEAQDMKVASAQLFWATEDSGLAVQTKSNRFFVVNNVRQPKIIRMPDASGTAGRSKTPTCWTVVHHARTTKIFACYDAEIFLLSQGQQPELMFPDFETPVKSYVGIAVSPDCKKVALLSQNGLVQVTSNDFLNSFCEADSRIRKPIAKFLWCGNNAVACVETNRLVLVGLDGQTAEFSLDDGTHVSPEMDGLRLISSLRHEFLSEVPESALQLFTVASMAPGALLLEAMKEFKSENYKSHDYITLLDEQKSLGTAVSQCTLGAAHAYDPAVQLQALEAASFGKAFAGPEGGDEFLTVSRALRVLNSVRAYYIGIPLTYAQYEDLTAQILVDRLIARRQWPLAAKICDWLRIEPEEGMNRVLAHWAMFKMQQSNASDEDITNAIKRRFGSTPGVPFVDVACRASELGRRSLALMLLDCEPMISKQIGLLMRLENPGKALQRAIQSGDSELVYYVILHLKEIQEKKGDLDLILRRYPYAFKLYCQYCREESPQNLLALLQQENDFVGQAMLHLQQASRANIFEVQEKVEATKEAEKCFEHAKDDVSKRLTEEQSRLLRIQDDLDQKMSTALVDLPLRDTFMYLVGKREFAKADGLKKEFKITEKQYWWWKIEALAPNLLPDLLNFSKSKKSPIGYLPFVEVCMKNGHEDDAANYAKRLTGEDKVKGFLLMNMLAEAAEAAFELKSMPLLEKVQARCGHQNRTLSERITHLKGLLAAGRR